MIIKIRVSPRNGFRGAAGFRFSADILQIIIEGFIIEKKKTYPKKILFDVRRGRALRSAEYPCTPFWGEGGRPGLSELGNSIKLAEIEENQRKQQKIEENRWRSMKCTEIEENQRKSKKFEENPRKLKKSKKAQEDHRKPKNIGEIKEHRRMSKEIKGNQRKSNKFKENHRKQQKIKENRIELPDSSLLRVSRESPETFPRAS